MTSTIIELPDDVLAQARDLAHMTNRRVEEVLAEAVMHGLGRAAPEPVIQDEVIWADFLQRGLLTAETIARIRSSPQRILGLNQGAITATADFDAPLPDDFWLGSE
jgi:predicted transcriptional regulator